MQVIRSRVVTKTASSKGAWECLSTESPQPWPDKGTVLVDLSEDILPSGELLLGLDTRNVIVTTGLGTDEDTLRDEHGT